MYIGHEGKTYSEMLMTTPQTLLKDDLYVANTTE